MNEYERKQLARRERLERAAQRARNEADRRFDAADLRESKSGIPFGQPVLVGHHSEKRHRRALERADANMRKGSEALAQARELAAKAAAVGTGGISSDDPDAVSKLVEEAEQLERRQAFMVKANALRRKHQADPATGAAAIVAHAESVGQRFSHALAIKLFEPDCCGRFGFPDYALQNNGANLRRIRARIERLKAQRQRAEAVEAGTVKAWEFRTSAGSAVEDLAANRCVLTFARRLSREEYSLARSRGFIWARTLGSFVRKPSSAARWGAEDLLRAVERNDLRARLFIAVHAAGVAYCDKGREVAGDYARIAFRPYSTGVVEYKEGSEPFRALIEEDAARHPIGSTFEVSACGQTITMGHEAQQKGTPCA